MARTRPESCARLACALVLFALVSISRGERVHFRIHSDDILDQHTHTRTVLLPPGSEKLRQLRQQPHHAALYYHGNAPQAVLGNPQQAVSFIRQTLQLPLQQQTQPHATRTPRPPGLGAVPGLAATHIQRVPIMPIIPLPALANSAQVLQPAPGTVVLPGLGAQRVTHQMAGPGPWPLHMLMPHGPKGELVPMRLVAVAHVPRPTTPSTAGKPSAALRSVPSVADLKQGTGCKAFIKAGEEPEAGDCFLEEYENGYNEERSKKTFFGNDKSNSKHERGGARNAKRFKSESNIDQPHNKKLISPLFKAARGTKQASRAPPAAPVTAITRASYRGAKKQEESQELQESQEVQEAPEEDEDKAQQQEDESDQTEQSEDMQQRDEDDVEVFKEPGRSARLVAVAVEDAKPMWVQELLPLRIKQMDPDEEEIEMDESAPMSVAVSPEDPIRRASLHATQPRAIDDMNLSWGSGFSESIFDADEPAEKESMLAEVTAADFDHSIDGDDDEDEKENAAHAEEDGDEDDEEQDHAASDIVNGLTGVLDAAHPMVSTKGTAEKMMQRSRAGPTSAGHDADSPRLSAILASGGHVFAPFTPPPPHPGAFGALDPDRLESSRSAPVVVEFGHELSGFKVTREQQRKKW